MSYAIVYSSQTGNTAQLATHIKHILPAKELVYFNESFHLRPYTLTFFLLVPGQIKVHVVRKLPNFCIN